MSKTTCKRCGSYPSLDDPFHRGFGAVSRTDNKSKICSNCGVDEAMENFLDNKLTPKSEWPVNQKKTDAYTGGG